MPRKRKVPEAAEVAAVVSSSTPEPAFVDEDGATDPEADIASSIEPVDEADAEEKVPAPPFNHLVNTGLVIERARTATLTRQTHLAKRGEKDSETDEMLRRLIELEHYVDGRVAILLKQHPAYPWFRRVRGIGPENIAKVIYPMKMERAPTVSSLWHFCGMHVVDGHAPKLVPGQKTDFHSRLRTYCWRLANSILKAGLRKECSVCHAILGESGVKEHKCKDATYTLVAISHFAQVYLDAKKEYTERFTRDHFQIVPASELPLKDGKRYEPPGVISLGHLNAMASRRMIKLFLSCLWVVWRQAEGLPTRSPYAIERLQHTHLIDPWSMTDR